MRSRQNRVLAALHSAQGFLDKHDTLLDAVNKSGARKTLDNVAAELSGHAVIQDGGTRRAKGETANQRTLRLALRFNNMKPIAEVAKAQLRTDPNFKALTLPPSGWTGEPLVVAAVAMADTAAPHAQKFIDAGLPADFIAQLRLAADGLRSSLNSRQQNQRERVGATKGLKAMEQKGSNVLKLLDALVIPKLGVNDALIAEWKAARKIHARGGPVIGSQAVARTGASQTPAVPSTSPSPVGVPSITTATSQGTAQAA